MASTKTGSNCKIFMTEYRAGKIFQKRLANGKERRHISKIRELRKVTNFEGLTSLIQGLQSQLLN